nr:hypothetical protein [uncultured Porphyromonas sp.]
MSKPHPFVDLLMPRSESQRSTEGKNTLAKEGLHPDEFVGTIHGVKGRCLERSERSLPKG